MSTETALRREDFVNDVEVRWCPGCGDYAVLSTVQKVLPKLGMPRENFVFISGIGCSSRFPYYMNTYGFHTIHGRAMTVATGLKVARPELSVWVITGDGDALSIGGNHFIHTLRRNVGINIILFNNRIYGLTKGQYSPTSEKGKKTKSSPMGSIDYPVRTISMALAAEATFVARTIDVYTDHLAEVIEAAWRHKGVSFVEVYQNCAIFNDGAFRNISDREVRDDRVLFLQEGKPMLFGRERNKGLVIRDQAPAVVTVGQDGVTEADIIQHRPDVENPTIAFMLSRMSYPDFPVPIGIFRNLQRPSYNEMVAEMRRAGVEQKGKADLTKLMQGSETWRVP